MTVYAGHVRKATRSHANSGRTGIDPTRRPKMEAIGRLAGGVAHDINNLLTAIVLNSDVLAERVAEQNLSALAETTRMSAERAGDLIHQLLSFLRGQKALPQATDVNAVVVSMGSMLGRTLGEHIAVQIAAEAPEATVMVDPGQLEAAIVNLALNARDAMGQGGSLIITTSNAAPGKQTRRTAGAGNPVVLIQVADSGPGMTADVVARAAEPFFTTKERGHGTGLGLSIVRGFACDAGGRLRIESRPGIGATVTIVLPVVAKAPVQQDFDCRHDSPRGSESILLVEDDRIVRAHIEAALIELGYRVVGVANALQAHQGFLAAGVIDLLLTDMMLPGGMNGGELAGRLRGCQPGLKVLYTSGYAVSPTTAAWMEREPGSAFLAKPFRRNGLAGSVRALLDGNGTPSFPGA